MGTMSSEKNKVDLNFEWFKENYDQLKKLYQVEDDDYVIIYNQKFVKKFKNYSEAVIYAKLNIKEEGYVIQKNSDLNSKSNCFGYVGLYM